MKLMQNFLKTVGSVDFSFDGHDYLYSAFEPGTNDKFTFEQAQDFCHDYCMEPISLETQEEFDLIVGFMRQYKVPYLWTSGRVCPSGACSLENREWTWLGSGQPIDSSEYVPEGWRERPWSYTGHFKWIQPDNAEYRLNGNTEDCLALLYNVYKDGIKFHDVACKATLFLLYLSELTLHPFQVIIRKPQFVRPCEHLRGKLFQFLYIPI